MISTINPETAAHNIATAFCEHEIKKLPETAFIPGDTEFAKPAIKQIWQLYSNVYDSVFEAAVSENTWSTDEK